MSIRWSRRCSPSPAWTGLTLLPSGPVPPNPAEVLNSSQVQGIFARLRDDYDLVLIDSPPVLPVTDAAILSRYADATLMLAAAGQTRRGDLHRAVEKLEQSGTTIMGVVLNKVTKQTGRDYGYGYGYGYKPYQQPGDGILFGASEREQRSVGSQPAVRLPSALIPLRPYMWESREGGHPVRWTAGRSGQNVRTILLCQASHGFRHNFLISTLVVPQVKI